MGDDFIQASILCTALLRQLGVKQLIARSTSDLHSRILTSLGVDKVVQPESFVGERLARQIASPGLLGQLELGKGAEAVFANHGEHFKLRELL
jgi:trk system potassium uptake protein TrkA